MERQHLIYDEMNVVYLFRPRIIVHVIHTWNGKVDTWCSINQWTDFRDLNLV